MKASLFSLILIAFAFSNADAAPTRTSAAKIKMKTSSVGPATNKVQAPLSMTPVIGMANMSLRGLDKISTSSDNGASFGALMDIQTPRVKELFLQTGVLYNQFGAKAGNLPNEDRYKDITGLRYNISYLSIPMLAKYNFLSVDGNTFFAKGGIMPGVVVGKELRGTVSGNGLNSSHISDIKAYDLPVVLGLGGRIPFEKDYAMMLDASWLRSAMTIHGNQNVYNQGFMLSAGINIAL